MQHPAHEYTVPGVYDVTLIAGGAGRRRHPDRGGLRHRRRRADRGVQRLRLQRHGAPGGRLQRPLDATPTAGSGTSATATASTLQNPEHTYSGDGTFTVRLIATNACGTDTLTAVDLITVDPVPAPVAAFAVDPAAGCAPLAVTFTDQSAGGVTEWFWDFGDGGDSFDQNPVHLYADPGAYDVRLIVGAPGGVDTLTVTGAVTVGTPVTAAFAVNDSLGAPPLNTTFVDQSTGGATSWLWDFGDGATDTLQNPVHAYTTEGLFTVSLIVGNGCSADTLTVPGAVLVSSLSGVGGRVPAGFGLAQNYPNPFNPSTTLVFALSKAGPVRLEIFDTAGRRVAVLVDEERAAGEHSVLWQPRGLASGMYFARFAAEGRHDTRRLVLLK